MKYYFIAFLALLIIPACSSSEKMSGAQIQSDLLDYNIILSKGGGFTGNYQGYIIDSTGVVNSFEGIIMLNAQKVYKGTLSKEQINEINKLFPTILKTSYNESGNMTTSILLNKENTEINFSWPGVVPDKIVPAELVQFYERINKIINHLKE